jgi:hypothetical protein
VLNVNAWEFASAKWSFALTFLVTSVFLIIKVLRLERRAMLSGFKSKNII